MKGLFLVLSRVIGRSVLVLALFFAISEVGFRLVGKKGRALDLNQCNFLPDSFVGYRWRPRDRVSTDMACLIKAIYA